MKTKIKIDFQEGNQQMCVAYIEVQKTIVELKMLREEYPFAILFERKHSALQTQYDLTGTNPCWLITFDENKEFVTAIPHFCQGDAPYSIVIPEPFVLLIDGEQKMPLDQIRSFCFIMEGGVK